MSPPFSISIILLSMLMLAPALRAQEADTSSCFEAIVLHVSGETKTSVLQLKNKAGEGINVYYRSEDHYTFWYRFIAEKETVLSVELWPTQADDTYHFLLYEESGPHFCENLVGGAIQQLDVQASFETGSSGTNQVMGISSTFVMPANSSYYLAVLNMTDGGCGHRLVYEVGEERREVNAIHQPCFSFAPIQEWIAHEPEVLIEEDTDLVLPVEQPDPEPEVIAAEPLERPMPMASRKAEKNNVPEVKSSEPAQASALAFELEAANKIELREIYFHNNTYAFTKQSGNQLNDLYELMQSKPDLEIVVHGHTSGNTRKIKPDPNTVHLGEGWNFKGNSRQLSKKRAEAVKKHLVKRGVDSKRIKTEGHADDQKIIENPNTPQDHMRNMRVEITVAP
ncbi:MAG: OmpA family protein [Cryomorphaceae bacterium]|nr:MAG: OmpA family protein [Cryomorphaceae bacterium]